MNINNFTANILDCIDDIKCVLKEYETKDDRKYKMIFLNSIRYSLLQIYSHFKIISKALYKREGSESFVESIEYCIRRNYMSPCDTGVFKTLENIVIESMYRNGYKSISDEKVIEFCKANLSVFKSEALSISKNFDDNSRRGD